MVGDWAALSRRFCVDFVLPRPNAWRLDVLQKLAGCKHFKRDVVLTAHLLMTASRSGGNNVGREGLWNVSDLRTGKERGHIALLRADLRCYTDISLRTQRRCISPRSRKWMDM